MQRKMFQIIYFPNCNSKIWQEIIKRDNAWKLMDCTDVHLSFHNGKNWRIHPHTMRAYAYTDTRTHKYPAIYADSGHYPFGQTHTHLCTVDQAISTYLAIQIG